MTKIAVFDVDQTLARGYYILKLACSLESLGLFSHQGSAGIEKAMTDYRSGRIPYSTAAKRIAKYFGVGILGQTQNNVREIGSIYIRDHRAELFPFTDRLIELMKRKEHKIILISGSPGEIISPFSEDIGADEFFATKFLTEDGKYTGEIERNFSRSTKKYIIRKYIKQNEVDTSQSSGFGDRITDAGFMSLLGYGVAINPDKEMEDEARRNGWLICREDDDVVGEVEMYLKNRV